MVWMGPGAKERGRPSETGKAEETGCVLEAPKRTWPCKHLEFGPGRLIFYFRLPEL